jgi:hypothetical protein
VYFVITTCATSQSTFATSRFTLQHTSESPKTLEIYVCSMLFQRKHLLASLQMEARWRMEITVVLGGNAGLGGGA